MSLENFSSTLLKIAIEALENLKAKDITIIHTKKSIFDTIVVCSGSSQRHVSSLAKEVYLQLKQSGLTSVSMEGEQNGEWVLVDSGDIVVHIMLPIIRQYYNLESLWQPSA